MSFLKASQKQLALVAAGAFLSGVAASRLGGMVRLLAARLSTAAPTLPTEANEKDEHFPEWVEHLVNHEYVEIDEGMPAFLKLCADVGASQCWHKHGTFTEHLTGVWRILVAWGAPRAIQRMGLFHSTYSNSWVSLALFKPNTDRHTLRAVIGTEAEELVHVMCSVPRMSLTFRDVWASKSVPEEGITVQSVQGNGELRLSKRMVCIYLLFHVADWADQFYGWQDELFNNEAQYEGQMEKAFLDILEGKFTENPRVLWPGEAKPGLHLSLLSSFCAIIRDCKCEDLPIPPIFNHSTEILTNKDERIARDAYWSAVTTLKKYDTHGEEALAAIHTAIAHNPHVAEPHAVLSQMLLIRADWAGARASAISALSLLYTWGTAWDKRLSWEAWVAFTRMLLYHAEKETWPNTSMGMISIGVVSDGKSKA